MILRYGAATHLDKTLVALVLACVLVLAVAACGEGGRQSGGDASSSGAERERAGSTSVTPAGETSAEGENPLAGVEVGPQENTAMMPAGGREPDPARPLPDDPPEGIRLYPATTNATVGGPVEYPRRPPTNGDHDPLWQNCGFYAEPVQDRHAVHSLDHGAVWISYRPDLPPEQVEALRRYGTERYVLISPYPGQSAPVIATAWRVQLKLDNANDPRLREFVDGFRLTELAPLSGNGCTRGVGDPDFSG
ncbi:MAG: DUF3105 domain-containing protein [Actinomycetota bacterium]